jgi:hypothetical protein
MGLDFKRSVVLLGAMAATAMFVGPAFAAEKALVDYCEAMAMRFKVADVSHLSPDKLEATRRQVAHGERLCKSEPEVGLKALDLALRDIGVATK